MSSSSPDQSTQECGTEQSSHTGSPARMPWAVGGIVVLVALLFAAYTNHAWEDFYITYRTSVNLAEGNGLVFTPGQKVHTFTSPINTLLPALIRYLLGKGSDTMVLWIYRIACSATLAAACMLLYRWMRTLKIKHMILLTATILIGLESKVIDFTINGQEVAFMIFFLAMSILCMMGRPKRPWLWLGLAWAGVMYTRPDGFVYCTAIAIGMFAFPDACGYGRKQQLALYIKAALCVTILYLPWTLWTWHYYGSPVPHTITAKGLSLPHHWKGIIAFHLQRLTNRPLLSESLAWVYMPTCFFLGGWPNYLELFATLTAIIGAFSWLIPVVSPKTRAFSLAGFLSLYYLNYIPASKFAWYYPNAWIFLALAICFLLHDLARAVNWLQVNQPSPQWVIWGRRLLKVTPILLICVTTLTTLAVAFQMRTQRKVAEEQARIPLAMWLKEHARSEKDTVFIECLGYVGYFSNLKIYDYPGLSSPEVVKARIDTGHTDWGRWDLVIRHLKPDWIVLRPVEKTDIENKDPNLLTKAYTAVKEFDSSKELDGYRFLPGKPYVRYDTRFTVYKRNNNTGVPHE